MDLALDALVERMESSKAPDVWLLDAEGTVVASKGLRGAGSYEPAPFPQPTLWDQEIRPDLLAGEGGFRTQKGQDYAWTSLTTTPWVLVTQRPSR